MSHFIFLRQRIKVIETIKKTTGAMRLISMSLHSRLRGQKNKLEAYAHEIHKALAALQHEMPPQEEATNFHAAHQRRTVILVGSQKGLCGAFNETLFSYVQKQYTFTGTEQIITVGKYAHDFIKKLGLHAAHSFDHFSHTNFVHVANSLKKLCTEHGGEIRIFSNVAPTFFSQRPHTTVLQVHHEHHHAIAAYLHSLELKANFLHILHESLLAEQAARFVSMDLAYRNADDVLNQTKLDYNKTRQAYVTRELIELSGGMIAQE